MATFVPPPVPKPLQGEIWYVRIPTDPPEYTARPVVIVSLNSRNTNERASTVLVVPLSTTLKDPPLATNIRLSPGATGLQEISELQCANITTIRKTQLRPSKEKLRRLSPAQITAIAHRVSLAMGVFPEDFNP
jgi:mRNA-degrading endonuclease toxin of MazEF toxin-antitoxin module